MLDFLILVFNKVSKYKKLRDDSLEKSEELLNIIYDRRQDLLQNLIGKKVTDNQTENNSSSEEEISERLEKIMSEAFAETLRIAKEKKIHMRTAAYILAVGRVVKATELRGVYP